LEEWQSGRMRRS